MSFPFVTQTYCLNSVATGQEKVSKSDNFIRVRKKSVFSMQRSQNFRPSLRSQFTVDLCPVDGENTHNISARGPQQVDISILARIHTTNYIMGQLEHRFQSVGPHLSIFSIPCIGKNCSDYRYSNVQMYSYDYIQFTEGQKKC